MRPLQELVCVEGCDVEGEAMDSPPIGGVYIQIVSDRHVARKYCIDWDLRESSHAMMRGNRSPDLGLI